MSGIARLARGPGAKARPFPGPMSNPYRSLRHRTLTATAAVPRPTLTGRCTVPHHAFLRTRTFSTQSTLRQATATDPPSTGTGRPQNLVEQIVQRHAVGLEPGQRVYAGDFVSIRPHHVLTHDNTGAVIKKFASIGATRFQDPQQP
ncbi:mitochondrial Homoaconitase, partial [Tieghemiomyces parasiticus]